MNDKKLIIFDFDGVLVNTSDLCYSLHKEQNPWMTRDYFNRLSHGNFIENVNRAVKEDGLIPNPNWAKEYGEGLALLSTPEMLRKLIADLSAQYMLAICSSMQSKYINQSLEQGAMIDYFSDVLGSDVDRSKVVKMRLLLEKHGMTPVDGVFVTDTLGDIREGNIAGVQTIGVTWGVHDRETLEKGSPLAIVDTVFELRDTIERFFNVQA